MAILSRPYQGERDNPSIKDLLSTLPLSTRHLIDFPWRLSSLDERLARNTRIWEDEQGTIVAFAAWQIYWATLDFFIRSGSYQQEVESQLFTWATERFQELDQERGRPLPYWVEYREDDTEKQRLIEAQGFLLDDDYHYVQLQRPLDVELPEPALPDGFTFRQLGGESEVSAYTEVHRAAFKSTSMTPEWRTRMLRMPQYQPELDIVVVAPDGRLAGFCVGWFNQREHLGQIEPLGVHPDFQGLGLSRALLQEIFRRFRAHGAMYALVETNSDRLVALQAYEAAGFRPIRTTLRKGKWVNQPV